MHIELRTLIVDISARFGGSNSRVLGLLQHCDPGTIALATLRNSPVFEQASRLGLEVYPISVHKADPQIPFQLIKVVRSGGFHILDTQNLTSKLWSSLIARKEGTVLVSTLNSWCEAEYAGGLIGHVCQALERLTSNLTDLYIVVAPDILERLRLWGLPDEAMALIPNAVGFEPDAVEENHDWLCKVFNLPKEAKVCCAVGRLVAAKGYQFLIRAVAMIHAPELHCLIIGEGKLKNDLEALITHLGLEKRVRLLGFKEPDQVYKIIKSSDMFAMPSLSEGTPIALLESALLGTPIVASRAGGIPHLVNDQEHALLVDPGDELALGEAINHLLEHPGLRAKLGRQAKEHILMNFSLEAQCSATKAAYDRAVQRAKHRKKA